MNEPRTEPRRLVPAAPCPSAADLRRFLDLSVAPANAPRPAWAVELGVELPCDASSVRRAFRRRALQTHPDRPGGSHEAFLRSMRALDQGLSALASAA